MRRRLFGIGTRKRELRASQVPTRAHPLRELQRLFGNRSVTAATASRVGEPEDDAKASGLEADEGKPLPQQSRSQMQRLLREDLSDVRVHTDGPEAELATKLNASAVTVGRDIVFAPGRYEPGSPAGDAIIAHELAHVAQQRHGSAPPQGALASGDVARERDADRSAFRAILAGQLENRGIKANRAYSARPGLRSAIVPQLSSCSSKGGLKPPEYLGPHSIKALEEINRIVESTELLGQLIVYGTAINMGSDPVATGVSVGVSGESTLSPEAEALQAIPVIRRERVLTVIALLRLEHENEMNDQEKAFWDRIERQFRAPTAIERGSSEKR